MSQVQSVQKLANASSASYLITILLSNLGSVAITSKSIFYQYTLQLDATGAFSVQQVSYANLSPPNFAALTIDEVKKDENIKIIARYLLSQQFPMLSSSSQVLAVYRDIPYYQLVFQGTDSMQLTFVILYGYNGSVSVMSATSKQVAPQQTYAQAAAQAAANGQTSLTIQTQTGQATQAQTQTVSATTQSQNTQVSQAAQGQVAQAQGQVTNNPQVPVVVVQSQSQGTPQTASSTANTPTPSSSVQPILQPSVQNQTQTALVQSSTSSASQSAQSGSSVVQAEPVFVQIKQAQSNASSIQSSSVTATATTTNTNTAAASTTANASAQTTTSISGFNHFASTSDQFYPYALQGVAQINQTLV
jgi:hypothetical protein